MYYFIGHHESCEKRIYSQQSIKNELMQFPLQPTQFNSDIVTLSNFIGPPLQLSNIHVH